MNRRGGHPTTFSASSALARHPRPHPPAGSSSSQPMSTTQKAAPPTPHAHRTVAVPSRQQGAPHHRPGLHLSASRPGGGGGGGLGASTGGVGSSCVASMSSTSSRRTIDTVRGALEWVERTTIRPYVHQVRQECDDAMDEMEQRFQLIVQYILNCKEAPSEAAQRHAVVAWDEGRHPDFPESRLSRDAIDRVLTLKVAELKFELSQLHQMNLKDVAKNFGTQKSKLQHRLLSDLDKQQKLEDEEEEQAEAVVEAAKAEAAEDGNVMDNDSYADDDSVMKIVHFGSGAEPSVTTTAVTIPNESTVTAAATATVKSRIMSPPKVSETADDAASRMMQSLRNTSGSSSKHHHRPDTSNHGQNASDDDAEVQVWGEGKRSSSGGSNDSRVVDTTLASIPFDEVTDAPSAEVAEAAATQGSVVVFAAAAATDMVIDEEVEEEESRTGDVDDDVVIVQKDSERERERGDAVMSATDSGRKRSRSPALPWASSPKSSTILAPSTTTTMSSASKRDAESSMSTSASVQHVQSTLKQLSVHQPSSPYRKLPKLGGVGSCPGGTGARKGGAPVAAAAKATIGTGNDSTGWDARNSERLGPNSSKSATAGAAPTLSSDRKVAAKHLSFAALSKIFDNDKFPPSSSHVGTASLQPPAPPQLKAAPPYLAGGGGGLAHAATSASLVIDKAHSIKTYATPSGTQTCHPSPIVDVASSRSAVPAPHGTTDAEKRKAMNNKVRQLALGGSKSGASWATTSGTSHRLLPPTAKSYLPTGTATTSKAKAPPPVARPSPPAKMAPFASPANMSKFMPASAKKAVAWSAQKLSPRPQQHQSPSPACDSYIMTDSEDEMSDDDEGLALKPKKFIPAWARAPLLQEALKRQYTDPALDADLIFGDFSAQTCDLVEIFGSAKKERYRRRGSSGNWSVDGLTDLEKENFRQQRRRENVILHFD